MPQGQPAPHAVKSRLYVRSSRNHSTCSLCCNKGATPLLNTGEMAACLAYSSRGVHCHPKVRPLAHDSGVVRRHTRCAHAAATWITSRLQHRHRHGWRRPANLQGRRHSRHRECTDASVNPRSKRAVQGKRERSSSWVHTTAPQEGWGWIRSSSNKHSTERSGHSHLIRLRTAKRSWRGLL